MDFRSYFSVRGDAPVGVTFKDKSLTRQEFLKESLTSTIMERFAKTGILTPTVNTARIAQFGDFSEVPTDLLDAHTRLSNVRGIFEELPASLRAQFGNDAISFVNFLADPRNKAKAIELGLIAKPPRFKSEVKPEVNSEVNPEVVESNKE